MIILVGESACGKSCVEKILHDKYGMDKVVSYTTRPPRENEVTGVDYNFIEMNDFIEMGDNNQFVEIGAYRGWFYGSTRDQYKDETIAVLTPHGLRCMKKAYPDEHIFSVHINIPRKDRLIKMLEREPLKDDVEECCRRSQNDCGQFDGIDDEVSLVIDNSGYKKTSEELADEIYTKYKEYRNE